MNIAKAALRVAGLAAALAVSHTAAAANAAYAYVAPSWVLGSVGTSHASWDVFGPQLPDSTPDTGSYNIASAVISETSGTAIVTGSGNIYSFSAATSFTLAVDSDASGPAAGQYVTATLQLFTTGTPLDTSSVLLNGVAGSGGIIKQVSGGTMQGVELINAQYLFTWNLIATDVLNFSFASVSSSMSLDTVAVDVGVAQVPVPAAAWLFGSAVLGLAGVGRRRKADAR